MINKESPSLENINKPQNSHRVNFGKTVGAITLIGALTLGQVGCSEINAINPTSITETTEKPTDPLSETAINTTPGSETVTVTIPTTKPTIEATTKPTTKPTTEATTIPTTKPTTEATTIPTTKPTTEAPTPTTSELEGVAAERLQFTKDLLNLYDNSIKDSNPAFNKIKDFVTREQIINYGKTGEGLTVIKDKEGKPAIAMINCKDNVVTSFKTAIKEMESYDPNYLKVLTSNGMRVFMVNRFDDSSPASIFTFNIKGLVVWNASEKKLSESNLAYALKRPLETESFGIKMYQLGGDYAKYVGFLKEQLSSDCWWNLYKKTQNSYSLDMSKSSYAVCLDRYNQYYYPVTFKDQKIQDLLKNIRDKNLASSFGGTWSEISSNLSTRPDWNLDDIQ